MVVQNLSVLIHDNIKASGENSFEDLVAKLLEKLTGLSFYLAQSGSQEGRDISARQQDSNVIAIECKRYGETTALNKRDLLGGLTEAKISIPDLDIWVLAASRSVSSQIRESLYQEAKRDGIYFLAIEDGDGEPSSIEILLASEPTTVLSFLNSNTSQEVRKEINRQLLQVSTKQEYSVKLDKLKSKLTSPLVGYAAWKAKNNQDFLSCIQDKEKSKLAFSQFINCADENEDYIDRYSLTNELDNWYSTWTSKHSIFLLLGEEGDGKTWGVAHWIGQRILIDKSFSPVVFLSSASVTTNNPIELISNFIQYSLRNYQVTDWSSRIVRWLQRYRNKSPILLLVLDGINEHHDFVWWRDLFDALLTSPFKEKIAVVITCRAKYWQRSFGDYSFLSPCLYSLSPYNEEELQEALRTHNIERSTLSPDLFPLICKPRYFSLMLKYRKQIELSGDVTVERLIFEDWKDRYNRKSISLDNESFQDLVTNLAAKQLEQSGNSLSEYESLQFVSSNKEILIELCTGGILEGKRGKYKVNKEYLKYGLGLILLNQLVDSTEENFDEAIEIWLEPHTGIDIKAEICHYACLVALHDQEVSLKIQVSLLHAWVSHQNKNLDTYNDFLLYFPQSPEAYIQATQIVWSIDNNHPWAQELLMQSFLKWKDNEKVQPLLSKSILEWLSYVHRESLSIQNTENVDLNNIRKYISELFQKNTSNQISIFKHYYVKPISDPGLLRLGRVALCIISHLDTRKYVHEIATGCLSEAISEGANSQNKLPLFKWLFIISPYSLWDEVRQEVSILKGFEHNVTRQAARWILSFEGSIKGDSLKESIDSTWLESSLVHNLKKRHQKDPCLSMLPWTLEDCKKCLHREDLKPHILSSKIKHFCFNPNLKFPENLGTRLQILVDQISSVNLWSSFHSGSEDNDYIQHESILYACAPEAIATLVRQAIGSISSRKGESLRQICFEVTKHSIILNQLENENIIEAWKNIYDNFEELNNLEILAEAYLFNSVLDNFEAEEQLQLLLDRSTQSSDLDIFEYKFKKLQDIEKIFIDESIFVDIKSTQRILWFLSSHAESLTESLLAEKIYPLINSNDSLTRALALKILYKAEMSHLLIKWIEDSKWKLNTEFSEPEKFWGIKILCEYSKHLSYEDLKSRLGLEYLGYSIVSRGLNSQDISKYIIDLSCAWKRLCTDIPDLPSDFPYIENEEVWDNDSINHTKIRLSELHSHESMTFPSFYSVWGGWDKGNEYEISQFLEEFNNPHSNSSKENLWDIYDKTLIIQKETQNIFFLNHIPRQLFIEIVREYPQVINEFISIFNPEYDSTRLSRLIHLSSTFYERLCSILIELSHPRSTEIYTSLLKCDKRIVTKLLDINIPILDYAIFQSTHNKHIEKLWLSKLESCRSDIEIFESLLGVNAGNAANWLEEFVCSQLYSNIPLEFARSVVIMSFLDSESVSKKLSKLVDKQPNTWRRNIAQLSLKRNQRNQFSKYWFNTFLNADNFVENWRCFRLFLQCVDRRYYLWKSELINNIDTCSDKDKTLVFLEDNKHVIQNSIKKNEKELKNTFLGIKISLRQAWPWTELK